MADESSLLMLDFDGSIDTKNLPDNQKFQLLQAFNISSNQIAEDIQKDIRSILPPFVNVEARIKFYDNSIDFLGNIWWLLEKMATIAGGVEFIKWAKSSTEKFIIPIVKPIITNVLKKWLNKLDPSANAYVNARVGQRYERPISLWGQDFKIYNSGEIAAFSQILDDEERLFVINTNIIANRGACVLVDANLNSEYDWMEVIANLDDKLYNGAIPYHYDTVRKTEDGKAYILVPNVQPSQVLVLTNRPLRYQKFITNAFYPRSLMLWFWPQEFYSNLPINEILY